MQGSCSTMAMEGTLSVCHNSLDAVINKNILRSTSFLILPKTALIFKIAFTVVPEQESKLSQMLTIKTNLKSTICTNG